MKTFFTLILLSVCSLVCQAQPVSLLRDLNPIPIQISGFNDLCSNLIDIDGSLYFCGESETGTGLWVSDGTEVGTTQVLDTFAPSALIRLQDKLVFAGEFNRNLYSLDPDTTAVTLLKELASVKLLRQIGDVILVIAFTPSEGRELWVTDGTSEGTVLLKDIVAGSLGFSFTTDATDFTQLGNQLFFTVDDRTNGSELWATDGTPANTRMVKDIYPGSVGSFPSNFVALDSLLVFRANDGNSTDYWATDGTSQGTIKLTNFTGAAPFECGRNRAARFSNSAFFCAGHDIWTTDGTVDGTQLLHDLPNNSSPSFLYATNSNLFFTVHNSTANADDLWTTDGTPDGLKQLTNISSVTLNQINVIGEIGNNLLFVAELDDQGVSLWRTDLANDTVVRVVDFDPQSNAFTNPISQLEVSDTLLVGEVNGVYYFIADIAFNQLTTFWKTDGTAMGTSQVGPFSIRSDYTQREDISVDQFISFQGTAFLNTEDPDAPEISRIWKDTEQGLAIVKKLRSTASIATRPSSMTKAVNFGSDAYFLSGTTATGSQGLSLWKTDATELNTVRVKDLCESSCRFSFNSAEIAATPKGIFVLISNEDLWFSDGSSEGTVFLKTVGDDNLSFLRGAKKLTPFGDNVVFVGWNSSQGLELWKSDGTQNGTVVIKDIKPGSSSAFRTGSGADKLEDLTDFAVLGRHVYFVADNGEVGAELWRSNGSEAGTRLVKDIFTLNDTGSFPQDLTVMGDTLFFSAFNLDHGYELWKSKGTASSTVLVKDIEPSNFTILVTRIVCVVAGAVELCSPRQVEEQIPNSSLPKSITVLNNKIVFRAYTLSRGYEMWISDGTFRGTRLLKDINPGAEGSVPLRIPPEDLDFEEDIENIRRWKESIQIGNELIFKVRRQANTVELWKTQGTPATTVPLKSSNDEQVIGERIENFTLNQNNNASAYFTLKPRGGEVSLWQTDGSAQSTFEFSDQPDPALFNFDKLFFFDTQLLFSAQNGIKNGALWALSPDADRDGVIDIEDNCQLIANSDQSDFDSDLSGDLCDDDDDNDGVRDVNDAFPFDASESRDNDEDGIGDNADPDDDNDNINDVDDFGAALDNCQFVANPDQEDANNNGIGDVCEEDELCLPIKTKSNAYTLICL